MNDLSQSIFKDRKSTFSNYWFVIVKTRFVLCVVVLLFSIFAPAQANLRIIAALTAGYFTINLALGFLNPSTLRRKRVRLGPAIVDIGFTSSLIFLTGGESSPWFLLYLFPIISVSRYLSYEGSIPLALVAMTAYAVSALANNRHVGVAPLLLKGMVFLGIAIVAANLSRAQKRKEGDLVEIFEEIDNAIIDDAETDRVLSMILERAMSLTKSTVGQMTIFGEEQGFAHFVSMKVGHQPPDWPIKSLTARYHQRVLQSKKPFSILTIKGKKDRGTAFSPDVQDKGEALIYVFLAQVEDSPSTPGAALFVPLIVNENVKAIISLFSKDSFHYSRREAVELSRFAPLLGIALKHSSDIEKKQRLKLLYNIAEELRVEQGLSQIFERVVELACNQLNSEEAALFVVDEEQPDVLRKVAVKGPSTEITAKLRDIEKPYRPGDSLVGKIFQTKQHKHLHRVSHDVKYHSDYSCTLPSGKVWHYIGVPLIIGEEVLGVIRVINKRAFSYSVENASFVLSEEGFDNADVELMQTIASQVASAIHSAKYLELQRYYQELVENSPDPIIVLDKKGKVRVFNKSCEAIWGFNAVEVIGNHVTNYYESERHARDIGELLEKSTNHRIRDYPARIKGRSGEIIPISLAASLLFDRQGNKIGSIGVFKDLRDTLKLQAEKTNAERLATLGKLAHTVGHEIKHDIATALNYVDTLAYDSTDDEELSEIYRDIQESLSEAVDKFQNMLMVGRPKPPNKETISAEDILRRADAQLRRRADSKKVEFVIDYPTADYELEADSAQLRQVLFNLFDNSIDAIESREQVEAISERGRIELSAHAANGDLQITWKDNGCGISKRGLSKIFTPFVTSKSTGNGLGLFIVKNIIENHGGSVSVESEEGMGTRFNIVLPLSQENISLSKSISEGEHRE